MAATKNIEVFIACSSKKYNKELFDLSKKKKERELGTVTDLIMCHWPQRYHFKKMGKADTGLPRRNIEMYFGRERRILIN